MSKVLIFKKGSNDLNAMLCGIYSFQWHRKLQNQKIYLDQNEVGNIR